MLAAQEFRTTSTDRRRRTRCCGVTLVELMISMGLTGIVATGLLILSSSTGRSLAEMVNYVDLDHYNRVALDHLTRDLRQVRYVTSFSSNAVTCSDKDGVDVSYVYSPLARTLTRTKNGQVVRLLDQCDRLNFSVYQRTPQSNRFDLIPITTLTTCKVITMTWSCSRTMFGRKFNTEQGQTARIVIRNKKET